MENYHVLELIGEGSFGKVYKGRKKCMGQIVAMKFIPKMGKNDKEMRNLRQEINILRKLNHENIVLMLDSFETKSDFCVVMEYAQGELYEILVDDKMLPELVVQNIAKQLVRALHYLHSNRIIHRDMKPQNILVAPDGSIKLCDFGFARVMSNNTTVVTSFKGTPLYMAPELVQDMPYNHTVDLWSLGVILYELCTGEPPFFTNNMYSLIQKILKNNVRYPKGISAEFKSFLKGLLKKTASSRLDWPHLADHPFVCESDEEKDVRLKRLSEHVGRQRLERFDRALRQPSVPRSRRIQKNKKSQILKVYKYDPQPSPRKIKHAPMSYDLEMLERISHDVGGLEEILSDPGALDKLARSLMAFKGENAPSPQNADSPCSVAVFIVERVLDYLEKDDGHGFAKKIFESNLSTCMVSLIKHLLHHLPASLKMLRSCLRLLKRMLQNSAALTDKTVAIFFLCVSQLMGVVDEGKDVQHQTLECVRESYRNASKVPFVTKELHSLAKDSGVFLNVVNAVEKEVSDGRDLVAIKCLSEIVHPFDGSVLPFPRLATKNTSPTPLSVEVTECPQDQTVRETIGIMLLHHNGAMDVILQSAFSENIERSVYSLRILFQLCRFSANFCLQFDDDSLDSFVIDFLSIVEKDMPVDETLVYKQNLVLLLLSQIFAQCQSLCQRLASRTVVFAQFLAERMFTVTEKRYMCCAANILANMASQNPDILRNLGQIFFESTSSASIFREMMTTDFSRFEKQLYPRLEGSNYGFPDMGLLDGIFRLFYELQHYILRDVSIVIESGIWEEISKMLSCSDTYNETSPEGVLALMKFVSRALSNTSLIEKVGDTDFLKKVIGVLRINYLESIANWPETRGGGTRMTNLLAQKICETLVLGIENPSRSVNSKFNEALFHGEFVKHGIFSCDALTLDKNGFLHPLNLISLLVKKGSHFAKQFVVHHGLDKDFIATLLQPQNAPLVLCNMLEVVGYLARNSKDFYPSLHESRVVLHVRKLMRHSDSTVKSKVCSFIGNLCRYSDFFYNSLEQYDLLPELTRLCSDWDSSTRKFACFAIGNAGFHNARLYGALRQCIPALVTLLHDSDERTRANAAGALGNLARNSNELTQELLRFDIAEKLLETAEKDSGQAAKIALFSLGNYCAHQDFRTVLSRLNFEHVLQKILSREGKNDTEIRKFINRIYQKYRR